MNDTVFASLSPWALVVRSAGRRAPGDALLHRLCRRTTAWTRPGTRPPATSSTAYWGSGGTHLAVRRLPLRWPHSPATPLLLPPHPSPTRAGEVPSLPAGPLRALSDASPS